MSKWSSLLFVPVSLLLTPLCSSAQETRGTVLGRVTDPSGAVVAGATVEATNTATNVVSSGTTNASGDFSFPFLVSGDYSLKVHKDGFRTYLREGIPVQIDDKVAINVSLELGAAAQTVKVVADDTLISVDSSAGYVVDERRVGELPLKDGNPIMLASLSPGVMNLSNNGMSRPFDNNQPSNISVSGSRSDGNQFTVDGAPNNTGMNGRIAYSPPAGVVSEFKIQTATFDATLGFTKGAVVNVSLKSGANRVHAVLSSFLQNPALNANSFFSNKAGLPKDDYRQNRWGATASGPIFIPRLLDGRNKTFWMYGYEGIRDSLPHRGVTSIFSVPTQNERRGDFSDLLALGARYQIYDPATAGPVSGGRYNRQPLSGNIIPSSRIDPVARNVMNYWPAANLPGTADGSDNYTIPLLEKNSFFTHLFRVDHNFSARNRFFVRGNMNDRYSSSQIHFNGASGSNLWRTNQGLGLDDVFIVSPQFVLNARYTYSRYAEDQLPPTIGLDIRKLGFSQAFHDQIIGNDARWLALPDIIVSQYGELSDMAVSRSASDINSAALSGVRVARSHTVQFGGEYRAYRLFGINAGSASGELDYGNNWTRGPVDNATAAPMGQGLASFLLGLPTGGTANANGSNAQLYQVAGFYLQDAWKLSGRLTLTFGMRWEMESATTERFNRSIRGFDFSTPSPIEARAIANYAQSTIPQIAATDFRVRGGVTFAGVNGNPRELWDSNRRNIAPRVSAAYSISPGTVLRAGFGRFYDIARQNVNQIGFSASTVLVPSLDGGQTFAANTANPFPNGIVSPLGSAGGLLTNAGQAITAFPQEGMQAPYVQRWMFSIQRRIHRDTVAEASYVGANGTHIKTTRAVDPVPAQYLSTLPVRDQPVIDMLTANVTNPFYGILPATTGVSGKTVARSQLLRPYPQFTGIDMLTNDGYSSYHALQTRLEKRFSKGFTATAAWTWSKFIEATDYLNETDVRPERVISDQDRAHRLVLSGVFELPFGQGRRWGGSVSGLAGKIVSGWSIQSIYQRQGGPAMTINNPILYGDIKDIPLPAGERTIERWFNTSVFETNSKKQLANNLRTFPSKLSGLRADGLNLLDLSASKNTKLAERVTLQFRAEFVNAANHPTFAAPNNKPGTTSFGIVTATTQMPRVIQFGLKLLF